MSITAALCEKIVATDFSALTQAAVAAARRLVLDGIAVAVAGSREEAIEILAAHYQSLEGRPDAVALGLGFRTTTISAAALNGAAMHVLDFEPMWTPATHALSTTLPAILALAEPRRLSGRDIVTALVKGIEIQGWIRAAQHNQEHGGCASTRPAWSGQWARRSPRGMCWASMHRRLPMRSGCPPHALAACSPMPAR
ncbi:MAG: MmgE/PrpD family protein [Acetobacteraceae bacterium]